jgi:hypothetical protein
MDSGAPGDQQLPVRYFLPEDGTNTGVTGTCRIVYRIGLGSKFLRDQTLALQKYAMLHHPDKSEASGRQGRVIEDWRRGQIATADLKVASHPVGAKVLDARCGAFMGMPKFFPAHVDGGWVK